MLYKAGYPFQWMAFARRLPVKSLLKWKGGRGVVGQSLPSEEGISKWYKDSAYASKATIPGQVIHVRLNAKGLVIDFSCL